jgi:hypothetical protein
MSWRFLLSLLFALAYLAWILRARKTHRRVGRIFLLLGMAGILIHLGCSFVRTLPARAPLRTVVGLATNRTSSSFDLSLFDRHRSDFMLIEDETGRRTLFSTTIDGPWSDKPISATYVDDGRFMPSVVRIEILNDDQFPWRVEKGHAGWVGTANAKRRPPLIVDALGFLFIVLGAFAPAAAISEPSDDATNAKPDDPGE